MQAPLRNAALTNPSILFGGKTNKNQQHTNTQQEEKRRPLLPPLHHFIYTTNTLGMCRKLLLLLLKLVKPSFSHLKLEPARLLSTHTHTHTQSHRDDLSMSQQLHVKTSPKHTFSSFFPLSLANPFLILFILARALIMTNTCTHVRSARNAGMHHPNSQH